MTGDGERTQQILGAAAAVIIRLGYDKTTMRDIANEAGLSRGTIYLYFKGKEDIFAALVYHEWLQYAQIWLKYIEADPRGGTIGGYFRATLRAINSRPFIASIMRRDRRMIGNYLRNKDNPFAWMQTGTVTIDFIHTLQAAGAIRKDVDPAVMAHILDIVTCGQLTIGDFQSPDLFPPYDAVMEAIAEMMDRLMTPEDGGDSEAGKAALRQITRETRTFMNQIMRATEKPLMTEYNGVSDDNE
jgi:TetR/AcrR family acrAB operon transcriptional repressor